MAYFNALAKSHILFHQHYIQDGKPELRTFPLQEISISYVRHMMADCCCVPNSEGPEMDITPQGLTISDNVTTIFSIK